MCGVTFNGRKCSPLLLDVFPLTLSETELVGLISGSVKEQHLLKSLLAVVTYLQQSGASCVHVQSLVVKYLANSAHCYVQILL